MANQPVPVYFSENLGGVSGGGLPNSTAVQFGGGGALALADGAIFRTEASVAAPVNPGSTNNDNVLAVFSLPPGSLDVAGRVLQIFASGAVANNVNSKRIKIIFGCTTAVVGSAVTGGTTIADTGAFTTAIAAGFNISATVVKYGAAGSNTQVGMMGSTQIGAAASTLIAPAALTAPENAAILIAITGNAVTTATDIALNFALINAQN